MKERTKNIDIAQVYGLWDEYANTWNSGDFELWLSLWSDDCVQMPPNAQRNIGLDQLRKAYQANSDVFGWEICFNVDEILILGDWAYTFGGIEFSAASKGGGDMIEGEGKFLSILKKQVDGSWKFSRYCFNYDKPLNGNWIEIRPDDINN